MWRWWSWRLWGWRVGPVACLAFLAVAIGQFWVVLPSSTLEVGFRVIAAAVLFGTALLWSTARQFDRRILRIGAASLALAAAAASFRSLDLAACEIVPFGSALPLAHPAGAGRLHRDPHGGRGGPRC